MRGNSAAIRSTNESDSASYILELHVRPGSESANYDRPRRFLYLVDSHTRTAALIGIRKNRQRFSQPEESSAPTRRTCERTIHLAVLLRPLRHHLFLLLLRELQMLLAEEPEPRSLRAVLAAWKSGSACLVSVHVRHRDQEQCRQPELVFIVDGAPLHDHFTSWAIGRLSSARGAYHVGTYNLDPVQGASGGAERASWRSGFRLG